MFIPLSPPPDPYSKSSLPSLHPSPTNNHQNEQPRPSDNLSARKHTRRPSPSNKPPLPSSGRQRHPPKTNPKPMALPRPALRPILHPLHRPPPRKNPPPLASPLKPKPTAQHPRTKSNHSPHRRARKHPHGTLLLRNNRKRLRSRSHSNLVRGRL
jgi:hypothetical protein